jgi:hypothetical protein
VSEWRGLPEAAGTKGQDVCWSGLLDVVCVEIALFKQDRIGSREAARDDVLDCVAGEDTFLELVHVACVDQR